MAEGFRNGVKRQAGQEELVKSLHTKIGDSRGKRFFFKSAGEMSRADKLAA